MGDNDISINDRQNDIYNNISVCEINCTFINYNNDTKRVKCDCNIKNEINSSFIYIKNKTNNFFDNINNQINYKLFLCYNVFNNILKEFYFNIGFWLYMICLFTFIICQLYYLFIGKIILNSKINSSYKKPIFHKHVKFNTLPNSPPKKNNNNKDNLSQFNSSINLNKEDNNNIEKENKLLLKTINFKNNNSFNLNKDNKNKNVSFINTISENKNNDNRVIIYLSKEDPLTKTKEYDISINK